MDLTEPTTQVGRNEDVRWADLAHSELMPDPAKLLAEIAGSLQLVSEELREIRELRALLQDRLATPPSKPMSLKEALPYMPPGARSMSSLRRLLKKGWIPRTRVNNRISINPAEVCAAFDRKLSPRDAVREFLAASKGRKKADLTR